MQGMQVTTSREDIVVRNASREDIHDVCRIYNFYVLREGDMTTFEEQAVDIDEMQRRYEHISNKIRFPFIVACIDGKVVGYAYAKFYSERSAYRYSAEDSIYCDPAYHRRGVGTVLMRELLRKLQIMGIKQVVAVLGTLEDNPGSFKIHSDFGFKQVALFKKIGFKWGVWVDRCHMQLSLLDADEG